MTRAGRKVLAQRVRPRICLMLLAREALSLVVLVAVPMIAALMLGALELGLRLGCVLVPVALLALWGRWHRELPGVHGIEALAVSAVTFALGALLGMWPMMLFGLGPGHALFESMSAITTTGLTVAPDLEDWPYAGHFLRHWFQWYGGLAIIVLAIGLVMGHGGIARRLGALDMDDASRLESARARARRILLVYLGFTALAWAALTVASGDPAHALLLALSALPTGGFAPTDDSLAAESVAVAALVLAFCVVGAISFDQWIRTRRGGWRSLARDPETRLLVSLIAGGTLLIALAEWSAAGRIMPFHALAQALSAQSTAGFSTTPIDELTPASQVVLIAAMLTGGDVGSSAGGFKLVRLLLLAAVVRVVWLRFAAGPRAVLPLEGNGRRIGPAELENASALAVAMLLCVGLSWLVILAHGAAPLPALFDVSSALATAGLSAGVVGPDLPLAPTLVFTALMWLGRVEVFAVIILFLPATWNPKGS